MILKRYFFSYFLLLTLVFPSVAQEDTIYRVNIDEIQRSKLGEVDYRGGSFLRRNPYKALVAPVILIGTGALLINNPVYDRFDFRRNLFEVFPEFRGTNVDDYLIYAPYVQLVGLNLIKINCENDFINTSLIILKAELINLGLTFGLKYLTNIERPNKANRHSWPSGHTSEAFLAATIVNREYRYKSPWIGVAAYTVAGTVGLFRMLNEAHWLSDVVAGAGIGILSANITYLTHQWKFGRPGTCFVPSYNGAPGFYFAHRF